MLTFVVPTWNRAVHLERSVCSIAEQVSTHPVNIIISDHGSTDDTPKVVKRLEAQYPCISGVRLEREPGHDYSHNFRYAFALPETEWTWTFGDDDLLMPGALDMALEVITKGGGFEFMHVSEATRSQQSRTLARGKLLDLCCNLGWIDMTGFITGNIVKTKYWKQAAALPSWDIYARNSFVQSCVLLEVLHDKDCAFYDAPLVDVQRREQTPDMAEMWAESNVGLRYHYVDDALVHMRNRGIIGTLTPKFFRYLSYHLWDRFLVNIINDYNGVQDFQYTDYLADLMRRCMNLTSFLEPQDRKRYEDEIREVKDGMITHSSALQYAIQRAGHLGHLMDDHGRPRYDYEYLPVGKIKVMQAAPSPTP